MRETVRDAAIALTHRGLYPSASHIADVLGDRNVMRSHTAKAVWREVLRDLGWNRPNIELRAVMAQTLWANNLNILRLPHQHAWLAACKRPIGSGAGSIVLPKRQNYELSFT